MCTADIQEYYEVTLLDEGKVVLQKVDEANQVVSRWVRPSTNNIILPPSTVSVYFFFTRLTSLATTAESNAVHLKNKFILFLRYLQTWVRSYVSNVVYHVD